MSDSLAPVAGDAGPQVPQSGRKRELLIVLGCLVAMLAGGFGAAGIFQPSASSSDRDRSSASGDRAFAQLEQADAARLKAVQDLLRIRSQAILHHDRRAFVSTLDPKSAAFRLNQKQMFGSLKRVHFASWSYTLGGTGAQAPAAARRRYRAPTWIPVDLHVHYRLTGFDKQPTNLPQYPTFVERSGHWYLASLTDLRHEHSATDIWDYAPVHVIRRHDVLVLGPKEELATMALVADQAQAAIPRVSAVWGRDWARRVVIIVPSTQREMAEITDDHQNLNHIAALTSSEFTITGAGRAPVGDRVTINPTNWPTFGTLGASIVITHELTHVATRAQTGTQTPKWLSEGFADYVGFREAGVPTSLVAAELSGRIHSGHPVRQLPSDRAFRGGATLLPEAYESSWLACRYLAEHYSQGKLVRFYRAVGASDAERHQAITTALRRVFGLRPQEFLSAWRGYVTAQLG
ncbi:MAG: hypothetical protein JO214_10725 [Frankiaceae bacterium]|nr:hypothetical protein [Frankiaceae bacterium]